jgi:cobalt-zinc-cadmium efflux system outer membrane protein
MPVRFAPSLVGIATLILLTRGIWAQSPRQVTHRVQPVSTGNENTDPRPAASNSPESNRRGATRASLTRTANLSRVTSGTIATTSQDSEGAPVETLEPPVPDGETRQQPGQFAGGAMTLEDVEQLALTYHPSLAEYQALIEAARGEWLQVGLYPNPIIGYSGQQIGSRGLAEQDGVVMQGDIVTRGKLRKNRAVAEQQIMRAEMSLATQQLRVLTGARKAFFELLVAERRQEINDELVKIGAQGLKAADTLFKAKEVGRADVLQARVEADQARILQANSRNRVSAAWRALAASTGHTEMQTQPVAGDLSGQHREYEWDASLQRLLGSSPELAVAIANSERARVAIDRARAEAVPNLTIQGIIQKDAAINSTDGAIQVTMPIPVFNRNQGGIRQAESEWIAAQNAIQSLELDLQGRLAPVFERYQNAKQQVASYEEEIIPNAKETLELVKASYEAGEVGYLNMLTAQRTFFQTNLAYLDSLRELWSAIWDIEGLLVATNRGE